MNIKSYFFKVYIYKLYLDFDGNVDFQYLFTKWFIEIIL